MAKTELFTIILPVLAASALATVPTRLVYQSPTGLWFENIAVRPSSEFLLTSISSPTLLTLDPHSKNITLDDVYTFPNATGLTGIAECDPDIYAVVAAQIIVGMARAIPGSIVIWRVDHTHKPPRATRIAPIPQSDFINGLAQVPGQPGIVLAADAILGAVYEISMHTGEVRIAIQDELMAPTPGARGGINGLHVCDETLYFTNTALAIFARIPFEVCDGSVRATGPVEILVNLPSDGQPKIDDFALDRGGRAWATVHPGELLLLSPQLNGTWRQQTVAGDPNGTIFDQPTSAAFGRRSPVDEETLYVTTATGQIVALNSEAL
ncbi:hypothetical protein B0H19DRAFT_956838 [Mycena capillaripes]|nr:hypothetical protein B0H19DRAFT_956838 [Mycena capillaripes]